jgi:hypothetical protein
MLFYKLLGIRSESEREDVFFRVRQVFMALVQFPVQGLIGVEELPVGGLGIPEVDSEVVARAGGIPLELSTPEMGIALKELDPGTIGTIGSLKAVFTSQLDFELPEDYKHRCLIFCSTQAAFQDNFKGKTGVLGVCSVPIGYLSGKDR